MKTGQNQGKPAKEKLTLADGSTYGAMPPQALAEAALKSIPIDERPEGAYEGETANGVPHGKGKLTQSDGVVYEGDFVDGKMHGKGKWTGGDGDVYEGDYVESRKHGKGKMTYIDGGASSGCTVEEGEWKDGKFVG